MKHIPILFSTPMVQAILEGRKTMTRRIVKPEPISDEDSGSVFDGKHRSIYDIHNWKNKFINDWSRWMPDDVLWVRESFIIIPPNYVCYKADKDNKQQSGYKPSIHMPKAACRLFLKVKSINVERLHDIGEADILAEGVRYNVTPKDDGKVSPVFKLGEDNSALSFMPDGWKELPEKQMISKLLFAHWAELWCKINGRPNWDANPWVWKITFEQTDKPANFLN